MTVVDEYSRLDGEGIDDLELAKRVSVLNNIVVHHKRFNELSQIIHDCHLLRRGVAILGHTGAGKSTLFKTYEKKYPRIKKGKSIGGSHAEYTSIPVLRVELDANSSPLNVASKMLEAMGDPLYHRGTEKNLTSRLKHFLVIAEVELIILDELQHLINTETKRVISKAADWLKQLLNDMGLPIVFGGIAGEASRIFEHNQQLDERFPHKEVLHGFKYSTNDEQREFRGFLKSIDLQLPLPDRSKIYDPYLAEKICYATLGMPRTLNHLLVHAMINALKTGSDKLEEHHFQYGFGQLVFKTRPKVENPFHGKVFDLQTALEKEKLTSVRA
jgi:hypothetical protein